MILSVAAYFWRRRNAGLVLSLQVVAAILGRMSHHRNTTMFAWVLVGLVQSVVSVFLLGQTPPVSGSEISGAYLTDVWTVDDGLPDSSVTAIAQAPDGYLWVGTYDGLARFDGMRFVIFDPENTPALAHARIRQLYVDGEGILWINTFDGSMTSFHNGTFTLEWRGDGQPDPDVALISSSSNEVTFLQNSGSFRHKLRSAPPGGGWENLVPTNQFFGGLWFCRQDGDGTVWYRNAENHLTRLVGNSFEPLPSGSGPGNSRVNCMVTDSSGHLWLGTDAGIWVWNGTQFQNVTPTNSGLPVNVEFLSLAEDGGLWAVVNGGVRKAVGRRWLPEVAALKDAFIGDLSRMGVQEDHHGGIWLYDFGRGLTHIAADGQIRQFGLQDGFPGDRVNCFFRDREGNCWAGLEAGGLVRIREKRFQTIGIVGESPAKTARSVCEDSNGTIWIGTLGDGLLRWQAGTFTNLTLPGGAGPGYVFCVCPDAAGRLWVSTGAEDLYVYEQNKFRRITPVVHGVKAILTDAAGRVWVGTRGGLFRGDQTGGEFRLCEGMPKHFVRSLCEDGKGTVWAGTDDGEIYCISNNTATLFQPLDDQKSCAIWSLLAEPDGSVWAGTFRGGLLHFQDGRFTRYGKKAGLPDNVISQIIDDGQGRLWMGSHKGVFSVAKSALNDFAQSKTNVVTVSVFGRSDGLPSLECSGGYQPAAWRGQDGRLWFTTVKGVVSVQPKEIQVNQISPIVVIEEVNIDGTSIDAAAPARAATGPTGMVYDRDKKFLTVPPGKHQVEFRYTGLSLVSSDRVQFRYRLEGVGAGWIEAGTRRFAQYNILPPGNYRFNVIACNSDHVWNETGDSLTLKILPYFYETMWFRGFAGVVVIGLVAGIVRYWATRRLRRKLEQLALQQSLERERSRIARDIHDDLGANLTLIARLGHLAQQEKTGERIKKMESTARQAIKSLDEIVWAVNPRNDTLAHLIDYSAQFANDYLYSAGVRCLLDVPEQVREREAVSSNVRHNIFLVIKEALQNIVRHAHASEVWLRISTAGPGLRISIEDNGSGFEGATENALADGLRNMRQRMNEVGGECRIQSCVGVGTKIIIEVPWSHK
jgi:signal transduction histidine kinase/ligand-binding sensor domain-containing protein